MTTVPWSNLSDFMIKETHNEYIVACYTSNVTRTDALWRAENALVGIFPIFVVQLAFIISLSRALVFFLRPLRQPPVVAEILAGILLGPSIPGVSWFSLTYIFPFKAILSLESVANLSLVYYMFLVGLDLDLNPILRAGSKAVGIAISGLVLPFPVGVALYKYLRKNIGPPKIGEQACFGPLFCGLALSSTNFHDLAKILADLKLLHSEIGRTALSAAVIADLSAWVLLIITIAATNEWKLYSVFSITVFILTCFFVLRPALKWILKETAKDEEYNDYHICFILTGVLTCGLITDACGCHSIVGAFIWGVILPKGVLKEIIMEKVEDFIGSFLLPTYFLVMGLRLNWPSLIKHTSLGMVILTIVVASSAKIVTGFFASVLCNTAPREALGLGVLMNTKGLMAMIILSTGREMKALGDVTFTAMYLSYFVMTAMVGPVLSFLYKSIRNLRHFDCKNMQSLKLDSEFRILACVHFSGNVSGLISLIGASNPSKQSPICVFAIHLVELAGRASAMLIVHGQCKATSNKGISRSDNILTPFEDLESARDGLSVHSLTAVSPYTSMHEDICAIAGEKLVNLILLPFHKYSVVDVNTEDANPSIRIVNNKVLDNSPSSVGLLVDRGLGTSLADWNLVDKVSQRFAIFFIGGPDDREALAFGMRMSRHPSISMTVVRFIAGENVNEVRALDFPDDEDEDEDEDEGIRKTKAYHDKEKRLDDEYIMEVKVELESNASVNYMEKVVNNGEETVLEINSMKTQFDLYIVGRGKGYVSPLTAELSEWSDNPELGGLGDALVSSSFSSNASVLVIQHAATAGDGQNDEEEDNGYMKEEVGHMTWQPPAKKNNDSVPFVNRRGKYGEDNGDGSNYY